MYYFALIDDKCFSRQIMICMNALLFSWVVALQLVSSQWTSFLTSSLAEGRPFSLEPFSGKLSPESGFTQKMVNYQLRISQQDKQKAGGNKVFKRIFLTRIFSTPRKFFSNIQSKNFRTERRIVSTIARKMA